MIDPGLVGLPAVVLGCLFDMDGVLTRTAGVHAAAWTATFDELLAERVRTAGEPFVAFDPVIDYERYVDGRTRVDGVRTFLASRGIRLPEGTPGDPAGAATVNGLSNRKNELFLASLARDGVAVFTGSARYLSAVCEAGLRRAVVSASANAGQILESAGLADCFEARIDGLSAAEEHLAGKPAAAMYLAAARALGLLPEQCAVFEDALAGVEAGRAGGFGYVVGVDRMGQAGALAAHGADIVVSDLVELLGASE